MNSFTFFFCILIHVYLFLESVVHNDYENTYIMLLCNNTGLCNATCGALSRSQICVNTKLCLGMVLDRGLGMFGL